jgi:S1-C subfamily serine protease
LGDEGKAKYQNFLQTDASINHGNSGGPLCNINGEVIGINTAISTPNEGSIGIGFAIPINMVKRSIPDLVKSGHVITPHLGFYTQEIDAKLAAALKLGNTQGVLVTDVAAGLPADKAGLKRGDIIMLVNGNSSANPGELKTRLYEVKPGDKLLLTVLRKGKPLGLEIETSAAAASKEETAGWHGLQVEENSPERAQSLGLALVQGLIVTKVSKGSSGAQIGLASGDVILEVNQQRLEGMAAWNKMTGALEENSDAILLIVRGRSSAYVVLPGEK